MRGAPLVAAALLCGCGMAQPVRLSRPRDIPEVPRSFVEELFARRRAPGLTVKVYSVASLKVRGEFVSSLKSPEASLKLAVPVFLIKHPEQGRILVDTGVSPHQAAPPFEMGQGQDIVSQLAADGISAQSVRWVIQSHLHKDRAGMIDEFPQATVIVDQREWTLPGGSPRQGISTAGLESRIKLRQVNLSTAPAFGAFDHALDLFGDGALFLVDLSGHSPGNLGVWLNLDSGPALIAGGASTVIDNHEELALPDPSLMWNAELYVRRLYQLREIKQAAPRLLIVPANDLSPLRVSPRPDIALR
ncbi:MAG: MBL fold metallo-hydrolase [Elusimicrobia bacterium]|nr:MBL fold metallo-hydrolase [Elusimicrobiota bacterium]